MVTATNFFYTANTLLNGSVINLKQDKMKEEYLDVSLYCLACCKNLKVCVIQKAGKMVSLHLI